MDVISYRVNVRVILDEVEIQALILGCHIGAILEAVRVDDSCPGCVLQITAALRKSSTDL